jgi:hypothetical protein
MKSALSSCTILLNVQEHLSAQSLNRKFPSFCELSHSILDSNLVLSRSLLFHRLTCYYGSLGTAFHGGHRYMDLSALSEAAGKPLGETSLRGVIRKCLRAGRIYWTYCSSSCYSLELLLGNRTDGLHGCTRCYNRMHSGARGITASIATTHTI